jgi:hypothetical protein
MNKMSDEQRAVLNNSIEDSNVLLDACVVSGKFKTILPIAKELPENPYVSSIIMHVT